MSKVLMENAFDGHSSCGISVVVKADADFRREAGVAPSEVDGLALDQFDEVASDRPIRSCDGLLERFLVSGQRGRLKFTCLAWWMSPPAALAA
jgi:hypothetical protein